jgi:Ca-activated chloride channel family protein
MHFAVPQALWLLLLLPTLVAAWFWLRWRTALPYPVVTALRGVPTGRARFLEAIRLGLWLSVLGLLIVAIARPRWPDEQARIPARSAALMMVLDISGSMGEKDFSLAGRTVSRLDAAKDAFALFINNVDADSSRLDDQIGLLTFAARAETICPPTLSHAAVRKLLDSAQPLGVPPDSSTNIGDALAEAIGLLQRAGPEEKAIVLLSDGEHNVPANVVANALTPRRAAQLARGLGIRVHTILAGPSTAGPPQAEATLKDVAEMTGGLAGRAADSASLLEVCARIEQAERTHIEGYRHYRYHEAYPWVGLLAFVISLAALLLEGTRGLRIP